MSKMRMPSSQPKGCMDEEKEEEEDKKQQLRKMLRSQPNNVTTATEVHDSTTTATSHLSSPRMRMPSSQPKLVNTSPEETEQRRAAMRAKLAQMKIEQEQQDDEIV